jgi:hypothetical protein
MLLDAVNLDQLREAREIGEPLTAEQERAAAESERRDDAQTTDTYFCLDCGYAWDEARLAPYELLAWLRQLHLHRRDKHR